MAKGNRTINLYKDDIWKDVFYNSVGTYVNVINIELSQEYPLEPLSDYIRIVGGYAFKTSEYKKNGVPIIRISDFNNEQIDISNCVYYDEDKSLSKYELNENDIIICLTGGTIAKLGIVQSGLGKLYMNQRVGRFDILDNSKFEKEYVYWIARSVQSIIKNLAWGAAIPNVSPKQIEKLQFSFPPIDVQKQIIEFLNDLKNNTIQDKIYFNRNIENHIIELQNNNIALKEVNTELTHQLDLIKQLRQAFLREAMQGKLCHAELVSASQETGHDLLAKIKAEKAQLIAENLPAGKAGKLKKEKELSPITEDEIPFEIPEHWALTNIENVAANKKNALKAGPFGSSLKKEFYVKKGYKIYGQEQVISNDPFFGNYYIDKDRFTSLKSCEVKPGDILISLVGTMGKVLILPEGIEKGIINPRLVKISLYRDINREFFKYYLYSEIAVKQINHLSHGSTMNIINLGIIKKLIFPLPALHEQEQIVAKLEKLMAFCDGLEQSIKESQGYNEQLLQQVLRESLTGEKV